MPSVAVPVAIMLGLGASAGAVAHRKIPGFWRASVVGGVGGMLLWIGGATVLVASTEGLGWEGVQSLRLLFKAMVITSCLTTLAATLAGILIPRKAAALPSRATAVSERVEKC
ncbi:MAG: hypothetical protein HY706_03525 [Candidatus Hydrogenedentes bacterium]|nr:hypothetical protein [Candidatus Hydrogenedentota bacterium]